MSNSVCTLRAVLSFIVWSLSMLVLHAHLFLPLLVLVSWIRCYCLGVPVHFYRTMMWWSRVSWSSSFTSSASFPFGCDTEEFLELVIVTSEALLPRGLIQVSSGTVPISFLVPSFCAWCYSMRLLFALNSTHFSIIVYMYGCCCVVWLSWCIVPWDHQLFAMSPHSRWP